MRSRHQRHYLLEDEHRAARHRGLPHLFGRQHWRQCQRDRLEKFSYICCAFPCDVHVYKSDARRCERVCVRFASCPFHLQIGRSDDDEGNRQSCVASCLSCAKRQRITPNAPLRLFTESAMCRVSVRLTTGVSASVTAHRCNYQWVGVFLTLHTGRWVNGGPNSAPLASTQVGGTA
jgi:hypothetical protein